MALRKADQRTNQRNNSNGNFEKAAAFLNVSLPTRDGQQIRLTAVPLTIVGNETHAQLYDYLTIDDKGKPLSEAEAKKRMENLKSRLVIDLGIPRAEEDRALAL